MDLPSTVTFLISHITNFSKIQIIQLPHASSRTRDFYSIPVYKKIFMYICKKMLNHKVFPVFLFFTYQLIAQIQEIKPISCHGGNDGALMVIPPSTAAPYTYAWSPGGQTTQSIWNLSAGTYSVTVTDDTNGVFTFTYDLQEPTPVFFFIASIVANSCDGFTQGAIIGLPSGGVSPYNVTLRGLEFDSIYSNMPFTNLRGGFYEIQVIDANGCIFKDTILVPTLDTIKLDIQVKDYVCNGEAGNVNLIALEADTNYYFTFTWSTPYSGLQQFTTNDSVYNLSINLLAGSYTITVTDDQTGCQRYVPITIKETQAPLVVSWTKKDNECFQTASGWINLQIHGGDPSPSYTVTWTGPNNFSANGLSIAGLQSGIYTYVVRDSIACTVQGMVTIEPSPPFCIPNFVSPNGDGINDVFEIKDLCNATNIEIYIYDMNGNLVFKSTDCAFSWDPLEANAPNHSVFYYHLFYTYNSKKFDTKGSIDVKY